MARGGFLSAILGVLALSGCGGNGDGGTLMPGPGPGANRPPAFTSPVSANAPENGAARHYINRAIDQVWRR